jgi:hypothetical protein
MIELSLLKIRQSRDRQPREKTHGQQKIAPLQLHWSILADLMTLTVFAH